MNVDTVKSGKEEVTRVGSEVELSFPDNSGPLNTKRNLIMYS